MAKKSRSRRRGPRRSPDLWVTLPESVLARAASEDALDLEVGDDDVEAGWSLRFDVAATEIARALHETGRPLGALHMLRNAADAIAYRRGYRDGARALAAVLNAIAEDAPKPPRPRTGARRNPAGG